AATYIVLRLKECAINRAPALSGGEDTIEPMAIAPGGEGIVVGSTGCTEVTANISTYSPSLNVRRKRSPTEISLGDCNARSTSRSPSNGESRLMKTGRLINDVPMRNPSDQLPCERARANAGATLPSAPTSARPGTGK